MKEKIKEAVETGETLEEIKNNLLKVLREQRESGVDRIGYVAGIVTSEGPQKIDENVRTLNKHISEIGACSGFPVFSPADIFSWELVERLGITKMPLTKIEEATAKFWEDILGSGYITDIFMTPRWEQSIGARGEHEVAKKKGLTIHYIK